MSQVATQVNGRSTSSMNEELLITMRRIAVASEKTERRVRSIELILCLPLIVAVVAGFLLYAFSLR